MLCGRDTWHYGITEKSDDALGKNKCLVFFAFRASRGGRCIAVSVSRENIYIFAMPHTSESVCVVWCLYLHGCVLCSGPFAFVAYYRGFVLSFLFLISWIFFWSGVLALFAVCVSRPFLLCFLAGELGTAPLYGF